MNLITRFVRAACELGREFAWVDVGIYAAPAWHGGEGAPMTRGGDELL